MSNHWDIKCETCNVKMGLSLNHGDSRIAEILGVVADMQPAQARSALTLYQAITDVDTIDMGPYTDRAFSLTWLADHVGHDLRAADEYGFVGEPVVVPTQLAWDEYLDLRRRIRRADDSEKDALVTKALELARIHDFEILLPMGPNGELTPEAARDLGESLGHYLEQHHLTESRAAQREAERASGGTPRTNGVEDQRELVRLRLAAEAKIRQLLKGLNNKGAAP